MADNLQILSDEITNDPLGRGYAAMSDQEIADSLNTINRDKAESVNELFSYLLTTRTHTNQGTDTTAGNSTPSIIMGRLIHAAEQATLPADPFGAGSTPSDKQISNTRELHSIKAFLHILQTSAETGVNYVNAEIQNILNDCINGGVFNTVNRDAIIAFSQNKQSRASELGLPTVLVGHVTEARA